VKCFGCRAAAESQLRSDPPVHWVAAAAPAPAAGHTQRSSSSSSSSSGSSTCASPRRPQQQPAARMQAAMRAGMFGGAVSSSSRVALAPQRAQLLAPTISRRGAVQVVAAEPAAKGEQKKKRTPQSEKRAELALDRRSRNRSRKSAIATRTKKVGLGRTMGAGGQGGGAGVCTVGPAASNWAQPGRRGAGGAQQRRNCSHTVKAHSSNWRAHTALQLARGCPSHNFVHQAAAGCMMARVRRGTSTAAGSSSSSSSSSSQSPARQQQMLSGTLHR
jgi:hypothetical protein